MRRIMRLAVLAAVAACLAAAVPGGAAAGAARPTSQLVWLSTYDWWNNSPPGCGIEYARDYGYPTLHDCAGGTGTWRNPITFAAQKGFWRPGMVIYVPMFRLYFIEEDWCATCRTDRAQMDLWVGGVSRAQNQSQDPHDVVNLWTRRAVVVDPPPGEPVNVTPLRNRRL